MKIFLSAVSGQFKVCRDALASDLRAIGCEVKVQEDFQQGSGSLIKQIESYVAQCDRVIAIVGDAYGADSASDAIPAGKPQRSYTQWEYFFAIGERLRGAGVTPKDLFVYMASANFLTSNPVLQPDEHRERQSQFIDVIKQSGKHRANFDNLDQLCRSVLRDGWQMNERPIVSKPPFQLPNRALAGRLFGRAALLAQLVARMKSREHIDIWGPAGMGKTALAAEAISQVVGNDPKNLANSPFPDGVVLLDLYRLKFASPDPAWHHLANSFNATVPTTQSARERAMQACRDRRALVIVEGAEEAVDGSRLQELLSVLPQQTVRLVLTRNKGQVSTAKPFNIAAELEQNDALALLCELWQEGRDEAVVDLIYQRFGGHPLALTWAGSQLNAAEESPKAFVQALNESMLPMIHQPGDENHTLPWLYRRSESHLAPEARKVLAAAGFLALQPIPLDVARAVLPSTDMGQVREAVKQLVRYGLLRISSGTEEQWEFTHVLTHQFANAAADKSLLPSLGNWAIRAFDEAFEVADGARDFAPLVQTLAHSSALLAADRDTQLLDSLASMMRLKVSSFLMRLGRDDLMQAANSAGHAWLESANAEKLSSPAFQLELSQSYINLGNAAESAGDVCRAREAHEKVHDITQRLVETDPENRMWQWKLSESYETLGRLAFSENDVDAFGGHLATATIIRFKLTESDPNNWDWQFGLWRCYDQIGDFLLAKGERIQARAKYQESMSEAGHGLATDDQNRFRWLFAMLGTSGKLGGMDESDGNLTGAVAIYFSIVTLIREWIKSNPNDALALNALLLSLGRLGCVTSKLGTDTDALAYLQEALEIGARLVELDSGNVMFQDCLVMVKETISRISK
jgi:tetratricopeptide (TPR) repeat protein